MAISVTVNLNHTDHYRRLLIPTHLTGLTCWTPGLFSGISQAQQFLLILVNFIRYEFLVF